MAIGGIRNNRKSRDDERQESMSIREGDRLRDRDGREWIVKQGLVKTMGETMTILEAADDSGEQRGETSVAEFIAEYEFVSKVDRPEKMDLNWSDR